MSKKKVHALNEQEQAVADRIAVLTTRLERELGLDSWLDIRHRYEVGLEGDDCVDEDGQITCFKTMAVTVVQWEYRTASIRWFLPLVAVTDDETLESSAIHEYVHVVMAPVTQLITNKKINAKLDEYVTESLACVIVSARNAGKRAND